MRYLKLPNLETVKSRWYDPGPLMIEACFQILCDFMEHDCHETTDWYGSSSSHGRAWAEMQSLYFWWRYDRPCRRDPYDDLPEGECPSFSSLNLPREERIERYPAWEDAYQEWKVLEPRYKEEDQRNLHRLVRIRPHLWA